MSYYIQTICLVHSYPLIKQQLLYFGQSHFASMLPFCSMVKNHCWWCSRDHTLYSARKQNMVVSHLNNVCYLSRPHINIFMSKILQLTYFHILSLYCTHSFALECLLCCPSIFIMSFSIDFQMTLYSAFRLTISFTLYQNSISRLFRLFYLNF